MRAARAFSMLEALVVAALIATAIAITLNGYGALAQSTALNTGAAQLREMLADARQAALTGNATVEVRFYDSPSPLYRTIQARVVNADGTLTPLDSPLLLSSLVAIDPTAAHSPLVAATNAKVTPDPTDPLLDAGTRVFHFLPDGSTDLTPSSSWFLTLRAATASDPAHFPSNWACLTLDPATGRVQVFRP
jgi:uncharacterized protein (TIGR02596 family)